MVWRSLFLVLLLQPCMLLCAAPRLAEPTPAVQHAAPGCCAVTRECAPQPSCCSDPVETQTNCPFCDCRDKAPLERHVPIDDFVLNGVERPATPVAASFAYTHRVDVSVQGRWTERRRTCSEQPLRRSMLCVWRN